MLAALTLKIKYLSDCLSIRGGKEFLSFHLDTVFDVNAIVSEVLL